MSGIHFNFTTALSIKLLLSISIGASLGCSQPDERPFAVYPVDGQLTVAGRPAAGAEVSFHSKSSANTSFVAVVRDDGHFVPVQTDGSVGLPEGGYALTVRWNGERGDRLQGRYNDIQNPLREIDVKVGINILPAIHLP